MPVPIKHQSHFDAGSPRSGKEIKAHAYIRGYTVRVIVKAIHEADSQAVSCHPSALLSTRLFHTRLGAPTSRKFIVKQCCLFGSCEKYIFMNVPKHITFLSVTDAYAHVHMYIRCENRSLI